MVQPYRTSSIYIVTKATRYVVYLCLSSGWFEHIEPHRTSSNHMVSGRAKCVEFCHIGSGWFVRPEPPYLQRYMESKVCRVLMYWFGVVQAHRTSSNLSTHISGQLARCVGFCLMGSGWFNRTEPPLPTSLQVCTQNLQNFALFAISVMLCFEKVR